MKVLNELAIILLISVVGEAISALLPFSFPASLIALFLMLILLSTGLLKERSIADVAHFLLSEMAIFFVPATVKILDSKDILSSVVLEVLAISTLSFLLTFALTGWTVEAVMKLQDRRRSA